jgi:hypothetical protein
MLLWLPILLTQRPALIIPVWLSGAICGVVYFVTVRPERRAGDIGSAFGPAGIGMTARQLGWPDEALRRSAAIGLLLAYTMLFGWIPIVLLIGIGNATPDPELMRPLVLTSAGVALLCATRFVMPIVYERWPNRFVENRPGLGYGPPARNLRQRFMFTYGVALIVVGAAMAAL